MLTSILFLVADMLNPTIISQLTTPPLSPQQIGNGKPRSRFSNVEDAIICEGVARGLTWGQISGQLPHRKRATCFNRYRTLQGIRKSRKRSMPDIRSSPMTPPHSWYSSAPTSPIKLHPVHDYNRLPALVAPLARIPLPYSYPDRMH
ncbi:hypothetical protein BDB01DRAFT_712736 [Pilobolus umbonatus]|nr:hypothetical protein BDB01DRAFT_712736 [Pilobolus umbonatus]